MIYVLPIVIAFCVIGWYAHSKRTHTALGMLSVAVSLGAVVASFASVLLSGGLVVIGSLLCGIAQFSGHKAS